MQLYLKRGVLFISLVASALAALPVQAQSSEEYYQQSLRNNEQEQQLYQYNQRIYEEQKRAQNEANQQASNQRAFREQEARNQAIRNADYWGAIAANGSWFNASSNLNSKEQAINSAIVGCEKKNQKKSCEITAVYKNTCALSATHLNSNVYFTSTDTDPNKAYNKAFDQCELKYGAGKCSALAKPACSGFADDGKSYYELGY